MFNFSQRLKCHRNTKRRSNAVGTASSSHIILIPFLALLCCQLAGQTSTPLSTSTSLSTSAPLSVDEAGSAQHVTVVVDRSLVIDSQSTIDRVSVANGKVADAVVISPREIVVNGKAVGNTSLIVWQAGGTRTMYVLHVKSDDTGLLGVRRELSEELAGQSIRIDIEDGLPFLRGTTKNVASADRAFAIASALGKPINLLRVEVPAVEPQILLRVKFASIDRSLSTQLGVNLLSTGAGSTLGRISTEQFSPPVLGAVGAATGQNALTLSDALNLFLFDPRLKLGATIEALQQKGILQILAEPNVLAINGKSASFLAGGEFPYPTLQGGGAGLGAVTIQFREFGIRLGFRPLLTPRGTIRLQVTPEVSALDYTNGLTYQGFTIPGLTTRRMQTEVELEAGQSFAIGGLLDNSLTETVDKIPVLGDIPWLGKLFQSKITSKNNTELLVIVTPEIVQPIPVGMAPPELVMPKKFLEGAPTVAPRTPGIDVTGTKAPVQLPPILLEELREIQRKEREPAPTNKQTTPAVEFVPTPLNAPATPPSTGAELFPAPGGASVNAGAESDTRVEFVSAPVASPASSGSGPELLPAAGSASTNAGAELYARTEFVPTPVSSPASQPGIGSGLLAASGSEMADARRLSEVPVHSLRADSLRADSRLDSPRLDSPRLDSPRLDSPRLDSPRLDSPRAEPSRFLHAVKGGIAQAFFHMQHLAGFIAHGRHDRAALQARTAREDLRYRRGDDSTPAEPVYSDTDSGGR
jgi:pilus assembly protein CpaC